MPLHSHHEWIHSVCRYLFFRNSVAHFFVNLVESFQQGKFPSWISAETLFPRLHLFSLELPAPVVNPLWFSSPIINKLKFQSVLPSSSIYCTSDFHIQVFNISLISFLGVSNGGRVYCVVYISCLSENVKFWKIVVIWK